MSGILHEEPGTFCCWRYQIAIKALSSNEMVFTCSDTRGGIRIKRARYNVSLYVNFQFCFSCTL